MNKITIYYSIQNGGDGSAYPSWFLTQEEADFDQENMDEGWGESCIGSVETFEGSDIHKAALRDRRNRIFDDVCNKVFDDCWVDTNDKTVTVFVYPKTDITEENTREATERLRKIEEDLTVKFK